MSVPTIADKETIIQAMRAEGVKAVITAAATIPVKQRKEPQYENFYLAIREIFSAWEALNIYKEVNKIVLKID